MKVFVDTDSDIRLIRRLKRDISHRGRDISGIIKQYNKFVKPAFEQYIEPTVQSADIVVPRGGCGLYWCDWESSSQTLSETKLFVSVSHRWRELCSAGSDRPACSQSAGEGRNL